MTKLCQTCAHTVIEMVECGGGGGGRTQTEKERPGTCASASPLHGNGELCAGAGISPALLILPQTQD